MKETIVVVLMMCGSVLALIAAVGVLRMPDLYTRMHAATKAGTIGVGFLLVAAAVQLGTLEASVQIGLIILFLVFTAPVAAHMIARAGYFTGTPLWKRSVIDELRTEYEKRQ